MNKLALVLVAWVALGLELSLRPALALGATTISPSFVICILTLVAMFAQPSAVRWTALLLGIAVDLLTALPIANAASDTRIVGPSAIAFVLAAQLVLSVRSVMMRRNPLTLGVLAMLAAMATAIALVTVFTVRSWMFDPIAWSATSELWTRCASAVYTGVLGSLLAFALLPLAPVLGLKIETTMMAGRAAKY
jgi:hypothetical protein